MLSGIAQEEEFELQLISPDQSFSPRMHCKDKADRASSLFEELRVNGSPQIVVDLSLVSLGGSIGSESFQSCPHSEDSNVSENSIHTSPYERPMSPVNGFKLRMSREESYLNESALSSVPTVIQSQRRILVPNSGHQNSPLRPMRLFSPAEIEQGPEKINCSTNSNAQENEIMRRLRMRAMSRHLRQQKRDATDHPGRRPNGDVCDQVPEILHATNHGDRGQLQLSRSKFRSEFFNFVQIGKGTFGNVFRCVRKLDLRAYALKEISSPFRSKGERERALREIYALATQGDNIHVVRYYSAWEENDTLCILTELCSGTLAQARKSYGPLPEGTIVDILSQVSKGLAYLHGQWKIAHLDVKPENMYTTGTGIYKLGDLGLACLGNRRDLAEEGDKRYLSREMLQHSDCDLYEADIFALGVSVYELSTADPLPAEGEEYHALRDGAIPHIENFSGPFQALLLDMMSPDPCSRPSAQDLCKHPLLNSDAYPCLLQDAICTSDVNILPSLSDPALLEWATERALRLEKESEILDQELALLTAEAKRWEAVARKRRATA